MQLSDLIAAVRDEVQDPGSARWTDATITRYLNDAQFELARISRQTSILTNAVPAGTVSITAPSNMLLPKEFWFEISVTWRYKLNLNYGMPPEVVTVTGNPSDVFINGSTIWFYPTTIQDGMLYIICTLRPTPMVNGTDTPSIQDADNLLIAYAAWMCLLSDGDPLADRKEQFYNNKKLEWSILDAQKNPMPNHIRREWWS